MIHPYILSILGDVATKGINARNLMRSKPVPGGRSAGEGAPALNKQYAKRVEEVGGKDNMIMVQPVITESTTPTAREFIDNPVDSLNTLMNQPDPIKNAGNVIDFDNRKADLYINPNVGEEFYAHELGHITSAQTPVGEAMRKLRSNPKLNKAIGMGALLGTGTAAALTPGDEDFDEAVLGAVALNAPILLDEAFATGEGLRMMSRAGRGANMGQLGRLAGGYLSYLAAPIGAAVTGNFLGNLVDENE